MQEDREVEIADDAAHTRLASQFSSPRFTDEHMSGKPYVARFRVSHTVTIASPAELARLRAEWRFHNPLTHHHLARAGAVDGVKEVDFYHGGDPLYQLEKSLGLWHEEKLTCTD